MSAGLAGPLPFAKHPLQESTTSEKQQVEPQDLAMGWDGMGWILSQDFRLLSMVVIITIYIQMLGSTALNLQTILSLCVSLSRRSSCSLTYCSPSFLSLSPSLASSKRVRSRVGSKETKN